MVVHFAAVHEKNSWRKHSSHSSIDAATIGADGAENLLRGQKRAGDMVAKYGNVYAVFIWDESRDFAIALRLAPNSSFDIERTQVAVELLKDFKAHYGPSKSHIDVWFASVLKEVSAMTASEVYQSIRPKKHYTIYEVALLAGLSDKPWKVSKATGKPIKPSDNLFQNSFWSFGGGSEPYLASIWWRNLEVHDAKILHRGNFKAAVEAMANKKTEMKIFGERDTRLAMRIKKANAYASLIANAYHENMPIRIALVDGRISEADDSDYETSKAERRELDTEAWWVHSLDLNGNYVLVRGIEAPARMTKDPFDNAAELGIEKDFIELLCSDALSDTEKDALVKVRVGQGYFRQALIKRWKGCAINQCRNESLLVASHIKPWSKCMSRAERLSPDNGILLSPTFDKLFDIGLISFNDDFKMLFHPNLDLHTKNTLPILGNQKLTQQHEGMKPFLKWHRQFHGFEPV